MNDCFLTSLSHVKRTPSIGGFVPFSTVDWPGELAAVVFIAGCPWACHYCHNPHLQRRGGALSWDSVLQTLQKRVGLLDGVVFSGGEPFNDPLCTQLIHQTKELGFKVAVHTAGIYPLRLREALPSLDWVGLDIKTSPQDYPALTARKKSAEPVQECLDTLLEWNGPFECRTTWHPSWLTETALLDLAQSLAAQGVRKYAVQRSRSVTHSLPVAEVSLLARTTLQGLFETFSYR
jgi:anaerobic ribonucleoside-triphosphate reductase activating protein